MRAWVHTHQAPAHCCCWGAPRRPLAHSSSLHSQCIAHCGTRLTLTRVACRYVAETVDAQMHPAPGASPLALPGRYAASFGGQLHALAARTARTWWRTPDYNATRFLITLGIALIFGSMYWKRAHERRVPAAAHLPIRLWRGISACAWQGEVATPYD